ncbi:Centrosome and spindle pole associated protein 1 [Larimichthys crocea]|uniref:Centrosome and spindle pole associated protein 1 n=1 Tax=Larimichthys crocea TaxID=215358 RepID=A0A6G0HLQ9_LARCR|nr:Centrosome and spindle pole associated protein 1 [Larimichthys crocea]
MPPASPAQGLNPNPDRGLGLSLLLGTDYERKKYKLQQELQLDYKQHVAKKKDLKTSEPHPQPQGLSLPIDDKTTFQEKLREERNKEYNLFLQEQAQIKSLRRRTLPVTSKPGQDKASDAVCVASPASPLPILNAHANMHPPPRERPASRRDAATLTEAVDNGKKDRGFSSEEELITDTEEELEFRHRRRRDRRSPEPEYKEERKTRERRANRVPRDLKEVEDPGVHDQNNNEWVWKSGPQMPDSMKTAARSRPATSKDKAEFATGLLIGATEEQTASHLRKEQYKQELLKQIAEQQENKMREKKLELRVAATGATDPEKKPDRIKQFGAVNRHYDSWRRDVPYKPGVDVETVGKDPDPRPKEDKPAKDREQRAPPGKYHVDYNTPLSQLTGKTMSGL